MGGAVRISVVELIGYREWTESLGNDREWRIQIIQSRLYSMLQHVASRAGGFALPLRYDYMLVVSSNMGPDRHKEMLDELLSIAPTPVRIASACGPTPREAEARASELLRGLEPNMHAYEECGEEEYVATAHIDINDFTRRTSYKDIYDTYKTILDLLGRLYKGIGGLGGLVSYLGGDNVAAFIPGSGVERLAEILDEDLKAGVGIAPTARRALRLAAEALHEIRMSGNKERRIVVRAEP